MPVDLHAALIAVVNRLASLAAEDAQLRLQLRQLAEAFLEATDSAAKDDGAVAPEELQSVVAEIEESFPAAADRAPPRLPDMATPSDIELPELTLGRSPPSVLAVPSPPLTGDVLDDTDLSTIEASCRLKAEGRTMGRKSPATNRPRGQLFD